MMDKEKLKKHYNAIMDKLEEMIPLRWTRILLYVEETGECGYADFYFYTEDGQLHKFVDIYEEYNQSYQTSQNDMDVLREINKALWLEFVEAGEPEWCTYSMDISSDHEFTIKYGYELYDSSAVDFRVARWAYDEYGIVPESCVDKEGLRNMLAKQGRQVPEELYSREKRYYIKPDGGKYSKDEIRRYEKYIDKYNKALEGENVSEFDFQSAVLDLVLNAEENNTRIFLQAMILLLLAYEGRKHSRSVWTASAQAALEWGDKEICREFVIHAVKQSSKSDVNNSSHEFIPLMKETKEEHVADIIGMVIEELKLTGDLSDRKYDEILTAFAKPVQLWRGLDVPKVCQEGSYDLIYQMVELCCSYKAYVSALRLSGLLYIADTKTKEERLAKTMMLTGKIACELGFYEVAKRCFLFSDADTNGKCWNGVEEKYKTLCQQETKIEITDEIRKMQQDIDEIFSREDVILYSEDDILDIINGNNKIPPYGISGSNYYYLRSKIDKARKKLSDKAMKKYEEYAQDERDKAIDKVFALFKEEPVVYEAARDLYMIKANLFMDKKDYESAYEYFLKAYHCKDGRCSGPVLLGIAMTLRQMGRMQESMVSLFRAYILCGRTFIIERAGEQQWQTIEKYVIELEENHFEKEKVDDSKRFTKDWEYTTYHAIAQTMINIMPCRWKRMVLFYTEFLEEKSLPYFAFVDEEEKLHYGKDIPKEYSVDRRKFNKRKKEIDQLIQALWTGLKCLNRAQNACLLLDMEGDGKFDVTYQDVDCFAISEKEGKISWENEIRKHIES